MYGSILFMEFKVQCLSKTDPEDLEVTVGLKHGTSFPVNLPHGLKQHRRLSSALLANDEEITTASVTRDNLIDPRLFIPKDPMVFMVVVLLSGRRDAGHF